MAFKPDIKEEHQRKLELFIADIQLDGTEIKSGTPPTPMPINADALEANKGDYKTNPLFLKYTGWNHWDLCNKWLSDRTTTCNEFVTKCAVAMGYKESIGRFDVADLLSQRGLGHCWVPADSGATPAFGDVFRLLGPANDHNGTRLNHMGVSLQVDGSEWYTVEGGQAGPSRGFDAVRRKQGIWKPASLQGWVSMTALLNAGKALPYWLGGWWQIEEELFETYFYHFGANGRVTCSLTPPPSPVAPASGSLVGYFTSKRMFQVDISWHSGDMDETLTISADQSKRKYSAAGKTALGKKLKGKRLILADRFDGGNR